MTRVPLRLVAALALLLVLVAAGQGASRPGPARPTAGDAPVVAASAVCPDLRQQPGAVASGVAVGLAGPSGATTVTASGLGAGAPDVLPLTASGGAVVGIGATAAPEGTPLAVRAAGPGAGGLTVLESALVTAGPVRGLADVVCAAAGTDQWLVGGGTVAGERSFLVLADPDPVAAVVDVSVLTDAGPADARPGRGLSVPAGGQLVVPLDTLAPDKAQLAVHVVSQRGRVAAVLRHERSDGLVPHGVAYAAPATPAATVVVPGMPAGPGFRGVELVDPGTDDLTVRVQVTTADGQFVPNGLDAVAVRAGSVTRVDLSAVLAGTPAAVRVTADSGVLLAAGVAEAAGGPDAGVRDLTYPAAAGPLTGAVALPDVRPDASTTLLLSALGGDGAVDVAVLPVAGQPPLAVPPKRVQVPGGTTVLLDVASLVPPGTPGRFAVQVTPDPRSGPVSAGAVVLAVPAEGPLLTSVALVAGPRTAPQPVVVRDPATGAGTG